MNRPAPHSDICLDLLSHVVDRGVMLTVALLIIPSTKTEVSAQEKAPSVQAVSASQFMEQVRQESPLLAISATEVDAAVARARAAGLWDNPSIAYDREEVFEAGRGWPENFIRLELPIEISGRRGLRVGSADHGVQAARAIAKVDRVVILSDAMRAYLEAAARRERLALLTGSREVLVKLRDAVRSRAVAGDVSGYDHTRIEIELSSLEDQIAEAELELVKVQLQLGMLAGSPGSRLDASDPLTTQDLPLAEPALVQGRTSARVAAARARLSQHRLASDAAGRGWVPALTLTGGAKTAPITDDTAWGYIASLALVLPIFNFGQADRQLAEARLRRARASLTATERQEATRILVAQEGFSRALRQAKTFAHHQLPRLEHLLHRAEVSYREGERPVFELLDAHRTYRLVRTRNVQLKLQARLSYIELLEALGLEPKRNP